MGRPTPKQIERDMAELALPRPSWNSSTPNLPNPQSELAQRRTRSGLCAFLNCDQLGEHGSDTGGANRFCRIHMAAFREDNRRKIAGPSLSPTAEDVARWMHEEFLKAGKLRQREVVVQILVRFGSEFVYENEHRSLAISARVLAAFTRATAGDDIIWDRRATSWRHREPRDPAGRRSN